MRILHVIPGLTHERGGTSAVVLALARHQAGAGHSVIILTTDQGQRRGEHPCEAPSGVHVERVAVTGPDRLAYAPAFVKTVRAHLRQSDVVHVHSIFTYPIHATLREATALEVPVVLMPHGQLHPYSLRRSPWKKRVYLSLWGKMVRRACQAWHYTSRQEDAASWPAGPKPAFVLANGVEPDDFTLSRAAAQDRVNQAWPQMEGRPYVLFLARLHAKKRLDLLLEGFLAAAPCEHCLVVAGPDEGGLWEPLSRRFLTDRAAARRVVRVGHVGGQDKNALLAGADLFALPSEHENFGIAALEALAAGVPVLLSPHVDLAEQALERGVGFVAPLESDAWRRQLADLLQDPSGLRALSDPARAWVADSFTWSRIAAELTQHYRAVVKDCGVWAPVLPSETAPK